MHRGKYSGGYLWAAMAIAALAACTSRPSHPADAGGLLGQGEAVPAAARAPIRVGAVVALTGPVAGAGLATRRGLELAIKEINDEGGVRGRRLELLLRDDRGDAAEAGRLAAVLADDEKVSLLVAPPSSAESEPVAAVAEERQLPVLLHAATNPTLIAGRRWAFRTCFADGYQGAVMGRFAREQLGLERVAILEQKWSDYSRALATSFAGRFAKNGGKVVRRVEFASGEEARPAIDAILAAKPDAIFLPAYYTDVGRLAPQLRAAGFKGALLGGDGWSSAQLASVAGASVEKAYFTDHFSPEDPGTRAQRFVAAHRKQFNAEPDAVAALAYDALKLAADALGRAGEGDAEALRGALLVTRDFEGVTGPLSIGPDGAGGPPAVVVQVVDGRPRFRAAVPPER